MIDRWLIPIFIGLIIGVAALTDLALVMGAGIWIRWLLVILFSIGPACAVIGFYRYIPPGPTIPALLAILILMSATLTVLAIAFLGAALNDQPIEQKPITYLIYGAFAGTGASLFVIGIYALFGAGRGWIDKELPKWPWRTRR